MFNKALEKINMDAVFLEDNNPSPDPAPAPPEDSAPPTPSADSQPPTPAREGRGSVWEHDLVTMSSHPHTTAYIFIWMLLMEAIRQCNPQVCSCVCVCVCVCVCEMLKRRLNGHYS